jgi:hypothetical protein
MNRRRHAWSHVLAATTAWSFVTPAMALPPELPLALNDDLRLYLLIGSGVLLLAALVMKMLRREDDDVATPDEGARRSYGMRFFPSDRPIAIE